MQIVIDILPEEYEAICKVDSVVNVIPFRIAQAIKDGTVLPENHGRLIDTNILKGHIDKLPALPDGNFAGNHSALKALINMQPTIIEADTESEDNK